MFCCATSGCEYFLFQLRDPLYFAWFQPNSFGNSTIPDFGFLEGSSFDGRVLRRWRIKLLPCSKQHLNKIYDALQSFCRIYHSMYSHQSYFLRILSKFRAHGNVVPLVPIYPIIPWRRILVLDKTTQVTI